MSNNAKNSASSVAAPDSLARDSKSTTFNVNDTIPKYDPTLKSSVSQGESKTSKYSFLDFEAAYITNPCFASKCVTIYNGFVKRSPESPPIKELSLISATKLFWDPSNLVKSQLVNALDGCLNRAKNSLLKSNSVVQTQSVQDKPNLNVSPFDRRLQRLQITSKGKDGIEGGTDIITPYSTKHATSATIGYTTTEKTISESNLKNKDKYFEAVRNAEKEMKNDRYYYGVPSIMNTYSLTKLYGSHGGDYLLNQRGQRKWYEIDSDSTNQLNYSMTPTTSTLINWGNGDPYDRTPYHFTDFAFCKWWRKIENNRLITLRRYPAPILDNLKFQGMDGDGTDGTSSGKRLSFPPMASAITYFGGETGNNLGDILGFSTGMKWGEAKADIWEVNANETPDADKGPGGEGGLFPGLSKISKMLNVTAGNVDNNAIMNKGQLPPDPYKNGPYENRILGPVNRIDSVKKREAGIKFEQGGLKLKFSYVGRPIGGINTKAVLLDILSNFLVIGSTSAVFFGGQHRFMHNPQKYPFLGGVKEWYSGNPVAWGKSTIGSFSSSASGAGKGLLESLGNIKEFFSGLLSGSGAGSLEKILGTGAIGNKLKNTMAEKSQGQIPYLQGLKALLTGEPVGEWHITIGNPLNPIAMIGNLVCDNMEVKLGDELGPDDFPLEMDITITLIHAMARDRDAIQSMFNRGMGRIYDLSDDFKGSAEFQSKVDDKTQRSNVVGNNPTWTSNLATGGGGGWGAARILPSSNSGSVSVWKRAEFTSISPNSALDLGSADYRSQFRMVDWVALRSLK